MNSGPVQRCARCRTKVEKRWTASDGRSYCYECADLVASESDEGVERNGAAAVPADSGEREAIVIRSSDAARELNGAERAESDDLGGLQQHFASFIAAHAELSERRSELLLNLRGVEAQLAALNDRAGRVNSILDGAAVADGSR